jgi:hypothetical protein
MTELPTSRQDYASVKMNGTEANARACEVLWDEGATCHYA